MNKVTENKNWTNQQKYWKTDKLWNWKNDLADLRVVSQTRIREKTRVNIFFKKKVHRKQMELTIRNFMRCIYDWHRWISIFVVHWLGCMNLYCIVMSMTLQLTRYTQKEEPMIINMYCIRCLWIGNIWSWFYKENNKMHDILVGMFYIWPWLKSLSLWRGSRVQNACAPVAKGERGRMGEREGERKRNG